MRSVEPDRPAAHSWLRRILVLAQVVGSVTAVGLLGFVVVRGIQGLELDRVRVLPALGAVVMAALSWVGFARAWAALVGGSHTVGAMHNWSRTQLLRYLPGAVFAPIARAGTASGRLRQRVSTVVVEAVVIAAVAGGVAGLLAGASGEPHWLLLVPAAAVLLVTLAIVGARVDVPAARIWAAARWLVPSWLAYGFAGALAQRAVGPVESWGFVAGASLLAWCVGFLVVFAPGGAGARELAYVALLTAQYADDVAAAGAVAGRVAFTLGEVIVVIVLAGWVHRRRFRRFRSRLGTTSSDEPPPRATGTS